MNETDDDGTCDLAVCGTGQFAARIVADLAATTDRPLRVSILGRNAERLGWLTTLSNARASMFAKPVSFESHRMDVSDASVVEDFLTRRRPRLLVQTASAQPSAVIGESDTAWSSLIAAGGLSATAVTQAYLSLSVGEAIKRAGIDCAMMNCCFPDVVNGLLAARGIEVLCGTGNVAILSNAFNGMPEERGHDLKVLAHYQQLGDWRRTADARNGEPPRVWIDGIEVEDVYDRFSSVKLTREPAIEISGASGVTLMQAFAAGDEWTGHAPGPNGLPGGYPVRLSGRRLHLDLPEGVSDADAIAWNGSFEERCGLVLGDDGQARYNGKLKALLEAEDFAWASGFHVDDMEKVHRDLTALRLQLENRPART